MKALVKYNEDKTRKIDLELWNDVYASAIDIEHNNTVQNILAKARNEEYRAYVLNIYSNQNVKFSFESFIYF